MLFARLGVVLLDRQKDSIVHALEEIVGGKAAATIRTARQVGIPVMLYGGGAELYHALKREGDGPVYCYDLCKECAGTVNGVYLTVFINGGE